MRLRDFLSQAILQLEQAQCDTPRLDAEVIIAYVLGQNRAWLYAHREDVLSDTQIQQLQSHILRREQREPVAYIVGLREFFGLSFVVTPDVLIPRPETERLVEETIAIVEGTNPTAGILEIGTGSGCISVVLAVNLPQVSITATDISAAAVAVARHNAAEYGVLEKIRFVQGDLQAGVRGPFDLLVSNPPYIAEQELAALAPEVSRYEPKAALTDGGSGLAIIRRILIAAPRLLTAEGALLLEFGADQGASILAMATSLHPATTFVIKQDWAGRDRVLIGYFGTV